MVIILYLSYIQNGAPKLLLMAQPLKHPQSESEKDNISANTKLPELMLRSSGMVRLEQNI